MIETTFVRLLTMTAGASLGIAAVLALRLPLRRAPKAFSCALWAAVLLRLLCPFSIPLPAGLTPVHTPSPAAAVPYTAHAAPQAGAAPEVQTSEAPEPEPDTAVRRVTLLRAGAYVWLSGAVLLALGSLASLLRLRRRLADVCHLRDNIFLSDHIDTPFVLGLLHPRIYLPAALCTHEQACVLAHEQAHIRHGDHVWKPLACLALYLHWFNPLVWLGFSLAVQDMEMCCDETAVRQLGERSRADYAAVLLRLSAVARASAGPTLCFGVGSVKARLQNLCRQKRPGGWAVTGGAAVCLVLALCLLLGPQARNVSSVPSTRQTPLLTPESANACIAQTLSTLTIGSDNTVRFFLPSQLPVSTDGKTCLTITLNAEFSQSPGVYASQRLLDRATDWAGGTAYCGTLDLSQGTLLGVMLRVAFMTELEEGCYQQYAADYIELTAPFRYDIPVGFVPPALQLEQESRHAALRCTLQDGQQAYLTLTLPFDCTLATQETGGSLPAVQLTQNGRLLGTLRLHPLGTTDAAVLQAVQTGESALPMPVFSSVALANHTGYTDYRVRRAWDTGAAATAQYVRQTLTDDGAAAEAYWQETDCVLAYDWTVLPYFAELLTEPGAFTSAEQAAIAQSMQFSIA